MSITSRPTGFPRTTTLRSTQERPSTGRSRRTRRRETSRSRLEAYALQAATLLKQDRNAAIRRNTSVATLVDAETRAIRSGASRTAIRIPEDVRFDALLPQTCGRQAALSTISFFANGTSCGGTIALTRFDTGYEIRVNWLTGRIEVAPRDTSAN